jgi:CRISPR-associated protein Csx17
LAHYLKALGILRLVSQQVDPDARGWWAEDVFWLRSKFSAEELEKFFLEDYRPSPIVGPWGARSGFFPGSSETAARQALNQIKASKYERLRSFKKVIEEVQLLLDRLGFKEKPETNQDKLRLMQACRAWLPDELIPFVDAAYVLTEGGKNYPPILGTGGNEGSGSYMSGYAQQVVALIIKGEQKHALRAALWEISVPKSTSSQTPGHFSPSAVGGVNTSTGFAGPVVTNPWDYLLLMEGVMVWSTATVRRLSTQTPTKIASPFTVLPSGAGYASAILADAVKPAQAKREPFEIWLPLWISPSKFGEVEILFAEGRGEIGKRPARNGVDFARAVASLGIARGIGEFSRHSFLMRNGQNFFAAPLGRWKVIQRPEENLLREIDPWLERFRQATLRDTAPIRMGQALRATERAIMEYCQAGGAPRMVDILIALGEVETNLALAPRFRQAAFLKPVPLLSLKWLKACDDGSVEFRLAVSLASIGIRENMEPVVVRAERADWLESDSHPQIVWGHGTLTDNLIAALRRRCMDAQRDGNKSLPLAGRYPASLDDIQAFIAGSVDESRLERLLHGLCLLNWSHVSDQGRISEDEPGVLPSLYVLLKLTHLPGPLIDFHVPYTPSILARAAVGDGAEASRHAIRRLRGCGWIPMIDVVTESRDLSRRAAGAVLFPILRRDEFLLAASVLRPTVHETTREALQPV